MRHKMPTAAAALLASCMAATAAGTATSSAATPTGPAFTIVTNGSIGSTWSYNLFNSAFISEADDFSLLPLAIQSPKGLNVFIPQLATSWSLSGNKLTVNLRHGVSWQQGGSVTSTDVLDTTLLSGVSGNGLWDYLSGVSAPNPYQIVFDLAPKTNSTQAEDEILGGNVLYPVPSSEYGNFVTPGLENTLQSYWAVARNNSTAAGKTAAGKAIAADYTALSKFNPPNLDGDGPFILNSVTTFEAQFNKYPGFYGASNIHVPEILYQDTTTSNNIGEMIEGRADYSWTGQSNAVYAEEKAHGVQIYLPPNYRAYAIYFHDSSFPLNITAVRQALAYVLHRKDILSYMVGGYGGTFATYPDILDNAIQGTYLTPAQVRSLNPYNYNPGKAASLLESVGFKKKGGEWYEPTGKPFSLSMDVPAGYALESFGSTIESWLSNFGIKAVANSVEQPGYWTYEQQGNFQLDWSWGGIGLNPLQEFSGILGRSLNWETQGPYAGHSGIGFGPVAKVPGLGRVNVPDTIDQQAATVGPGKMMDKLVWDWAKLANQQVPVLSFGNKNITLQISNKRYNDWPARTSPLWAVQGLNTSAGLTVAMEDGYLHPLG